MSRPFRLLAVMVLLVAGSAPVLGQSPSPLTSAEPASPTSSVFFPTVAGTSVTPTGLD